MIQEKTGRSDNDMEKNTNNGMENAPAQKKIGELEFGEIHPCSVIALKFIQNVSHEDILILQETLSSAALSGNRAAEICSETLRRLLSNEGVSDRYLMGLAWMIYELALLKMQSTNELGDS